MLRPARNAVVGEGLRLGFRAASFPWKCNAIDQAAAFVGDSGPVATDFEKFAPLTPQNCWRWTEVGSQSQTDNMMRAIQWLKLLVNCAIAPFNEFIRLWEEDQFGQRFVHVLIEILIVLHLLHMLASVHRSP